jgi:hypothetical protein
MKVKNRLIFLGQAGGIVGTPHPESTIILG